MSILKKLSLVQSELNVPKNQRNNFGNYNYRSAEDILEKAKPLCIKHGLLLSLSDKPINIGNKNYIEATASVHDIETSESFSVSASARESETKKGMDDSQITGSTSSYARKYALNGLFAIDDTKDSDANEQTTETKNRSNNKQESYSSNSVFSFGKHQGKKFGDVYKEDPEYFRYLSEKSTDANLKQFSKGLYEHYKSK